MRVGVAGLNGAGKTEVVRFFERRSFYPVSLSDVIRRDLEADGHEPTRERMIERGRALRERSGPAALATRVLGRLPADRHHVVDSIRHPAEVETLRSGGEFTLLWIEASSAVRYERIRQRQRPGDAQSFERFVELERLELSSENPAGQQLLQVAELADHVIPNDADLGSLEQRLQELLGSQLGFGDRPPWDEYFMSIARVVASRSNCIKRRVGCVVVVDRRIISTGYNGTPRGVRNCNDGGCPRCAGGAEAGTRLDECLCSHAEENSITQSAFHGVSVRGATVYSTFCPCLICTKMIINAGIREVVYASSFPLGDVAVELFREAGVKVRELAERAD